MIERNWSDYNKPLKKRGDITVYIHESVLACWYYQRKRSPGGKQCYSDKAIETVLSLGYLFRLPLRQTQGWVKSLLSCLGSDVLVPDYTTLSRRSARLSVSIKHRLTRGHQPGLDIVIDSTGLSVYSTGGWHRTKYSRTQAIGIDCWRKVQLSMTLDGTIVGATYTRANRPDHTCVETLLVQSDRRGRAIRTLRADKACYRQLYDRHIQPIIPARRGSVSQHQSKHKMRYRPELQARDDQIE